MDMRHPDGVRAKNVYLPRGSLLVMEGAARYEWSHGIASRKTDMVCCVFLVFSIDLCSSCSSNQRIGDNAALELSTLPQRSECAAQYLLTRT